MKVPNNTRKIARGHFDEFLFSDNLSMLYALLKKEKHI
jgi:hypothetical protein